MAALTILRKLSDTYIGNGELYKIDARIFAEAAADSETKMGKVLYLEKGIASAQRAVELSPRDISCHLELINLLELNADDAYSRQLAICKCEEALNIPKGCKEEQGIDVRSARTLIKQKMEVLEMEQIQSIEREEQMNGQFMW